MPGVPVGDAPVGCAAPRPWTDDTDLTEWEFDGTSDDQRRGPPLATVVDLDAEQTAWVGREADRAGLTLVDFVKKLIDDARRHPPSDSGGGR